MLSNLLNRIKNEHKVMIFSLLIGLGLWIADALVDTYIFFEGSFTDSLIVHVTGHELYFRIFMLGAFVIFSVAISNFIRKQKISEENLRKALSKVQTE